MSGFMFDAVPFIVSAGFVLVLGIIIVTVIRGIAQWNKNNNSPILTVEVRIVAKRMSVSDHTHHNNTGNGHTTMHTSSSTSYYATFEVESGDRIELHIPTAEYGMLVEGDVGRLTFQGTRYKGFERSRPSGSAR